MSEIEGRIVGAYVSEVVTPVPLTPALSAPVVAALERAWAQIRQRHPEVPTAVVVLASGATRRAGELKLGHFHASRWQTVDDLLPEVLIGGEGLRGGAAGVLATLLHEAAHGLAHVREVQETSRQGRYHNRQYAKLAGELGMDVTRVGGLGWSGTEMQPATVADYADTLADLDQAITLIRHAEPTIGRTGGRTSSNNGLACACGCGRRIRVAPSTLEAGPIICGLCTTQFKAGD